MTKIDELLNLLIQEKVISADSLSDLQKQPDFRVNPDEAIINSGLVDIEELSQFKAKIYGLKYYSLLEARISDKALNSIPREVAENYRIICFDIADNKMKVGVLDPENFKAFEAIDFLAKEQGLQPEYFLISNLSFDHALRR